MKFKKLGNTDIDVSLICLGTMNMGEQNTQEESFEQMDYSLEKGVKILLDNIHYWNKAPIWDQESISKATANWFKYLD